MYITELSVQGPAEASVFEDKVEWFSDLLRRKADENAPAWAMRILEAWTPVFDGLQASIYWVSSQDSAQHLELLNAYACEREQLRASVQLGEGLIGQAARSNRMVYLDDRSRFRPTRATNLSAVQPAAYLVAPLVYNLRVEGVIEMTLIRRLEEHELTLLRRMGAQLGAALHTLRNEEVTRGLYAQMQLKNEELIAQDEEMRQNLEEMAATQEELRRTKDEVERRQQQFERIASNIPGALLQLHEFKDNEQKLIRYASPRVSDFFGFQAAEVLGQDLMKLVEVHPDDKRTFVEEDSRSFEGGNFMMELRVRTAQKPSYRWYLFRGFVASLDDGSYLSDIYIDDINERKEQERELYVKTEVFTSSNDSIWILDGPNIIDCNEASALLFGLESREDMIGTTPFRWSPELQPDGTPSDELAAVRIHKAMTDGFNEFEWKHMRLNGETFDCEVRLNRIIVGDKVLLSAFHRDISYRKEMERSMQAEIERLRKSEADSRQREIENLQHQYELFLDRLDLGVFIVRGNGVPFFANQRCIDLLGKGVDPKATTNDLSEVYAVYRAGTDELYPVEELPVVQALGGKDVRADDLEIVTHTGRNRLRVHGFPIRNEAGEILYGMATFDLIED